VAWNVSYNRPLTPKGHIVVAHVPWFVDQYGICGVFGEDGPSCCSFEGAFIKLFVARMIEWLACKAPWELPQLLTPVPMEIRLELSSKRLIYLLPTTLSH